MPGANAFAATGAMLRAAVALAGSLTSLFATAQAVDIAGLSFESLRGELLALGQDAPRAVQRGVAESVTAMCEGSDERVASTVQAAVATMHDASRVRAVSLLR